MIDENEFFREISMRICGSLDIEKGLQRCVEYLAQHMPADNLFLEKHVDGLNGIEVLAQAGAHIRLKAGVVVRFQDEFREMMVEAEKQIRAGVYPPLEVINKPREHPLGMYILEAFGAPTSSYMGLPLVIDDKLVGGLGVIAEGEDRYNEHHQKLFATLKEPFFVAMSNVLEHQEVLELKDRLADDNRQLQKDFFRLSGDEIVGSDFGLRPVMQLVSQVAPTDSPVVLSGETGVGKDVIANAIHLNSPRSEGPFIPVNCGAIPESLIDSELFGHEKGAFTGALAKKRGRFERANGGTIFLDEIGDMPLEAQVRLLRVLQNREIERVGGSEPIDVDIRIIAATNKDLTEAIADGRFREDLWYRINVFPVVIPPLRERRVDIPALVHHFVSRKAKELKVGATPELAPGAIDVLKAYDWPGNVRELQNVVERAMILYRGEPLRFDELGPASAGTSAGAEPATAGEARDLDSIVSAHIEQVLGECGGKISGPGGAAEVLGLNPNTLRDRMKKLGIRFKKDKSGT